MKYFVTGTHAYGPVTNESDLDIAMMQDEVTEILAFADKHFIPIEQTEHQKEYENGGFYLNIGNIKMNIIVMNDQEEFNAWYKRTERLKTFEPIEDREQRITFFNEI